jgi:hypothetical protein
MDVDDLLEQAKTHPRKALVTAYHRGKSSRSASGCESVFIYGQQAKKIKYLKNKGGRLLSAVVQVEMPDKSIATIDDWGRITWKDS